MAGAASRPPLSDPIFGPAMIAQGGRRPIPTSVTFLLLFLSPVPSNQSRMDFPYIGAHTSTVTLRDIVSRILRSVAKLTPQSNLCLAGAALSRDTESSFCAKGFELKDWGADSSPHPLPSR